MQNIYSAEKVQYRADLMQGYVCMQGLIRTWWVANRMGLQIVDCSMRGCFGDWSGIVEVQIHSLSEPLSEVTPKTL